MRKEKGRMLKALATKGRERATDLLLIGSSFVGCIGLMAAART
jgi:hypothetical protein